MAAAKRLVVVELGLTAASNCAFNVKSNCLATSLGTPSNDPLDLPARTRQVTPLFSRHESLSHHRIKSGARQRDSPARFGQEERWCRPAHHENGAAHFRAKFEAPAYLGAGAEEVCACSRHGARSQDNQQGGRLQGAEESRRDLKYSGALRAPERFRD